MSHLIIDPSDFPFLLKNDNSYFYLRLIPTLGPIVGALIGANFGLQKFGCSYFILFLLAPSVIGLVAFLVCFRFLKPFGLLKGIGFVDGIRRKYGKGDATVGRTLVMDSIATIRESHRFFLNYFLFIFYSFFYLFDVFFIISSVSHFPFHSFILF